MIDETLRQAFRQGVPVTLIYLDKKGSISERCVRIRTLHPDEIFAYCLNRRAYRRFKRDQVLAAELKRHSFHRRMSPNCNAFIHPVVFAHGKPCYTGREGCSREPRVPVEAEPSSWEGRSMQEGGS